MAGDVAEEAADGDGVLHVVHELTIERKGSKPLQRSAEIFDRHHVLLVRCWVEGFAISPTRVGQVGVGQEARDKPSTSLSDLTSIWSSMTEPWGNSILQKVTSSRMKV